ncbi:MAG: hypothetical protein ACJ790_10930 [Myxococcaceae bacterium]
MSFLSTILKGASNPFIRQIASGVAGAIKGQKGADVVNRGFTLFDQLKSAFEQFKNPSKAGSTKTPSSLKDPRQMIGASKSASTSSGGAVGSSKSASTASGGGSTVNELINGSGINSGFGITPEQKAMLDSSGLPESDPAYKSNKLQMMMSNYTNAVQTLSNISKMLSDMQKGIIQNIRS